MRYILLSIMIFLSGCIVQKEHRARNVSEILKKYYKDGEEVILPADNDAGYISPKMQQLAPKFNPQYYYHDNDSTYVPPRQYYQPQQRSTSPNYGYPRDTDQNYRYPYPMPYPLYESDEAYKARKEKEQRERLFDTPLFY